MRKPQCTGVHEDFRIKRNAEIALVSHPLVCIVSQRPVILEGKYRSYPAQVRAFILEYHLRTSGQMIYRKGVALCVSAF